ncbi:MAG: M1 family metallopeptidase [Cyanobacteria bacterium]|nr:M1 family metallopeptidase [Cyanobacteria bacterium CG_2015-16_32_12]NCO78581.1 M1 family metallopeptidase [Cyanobacteria bacterium CG_2015-22_32_23]NCQ40822.1 M1 family metallopeptidase [Cyanobacteria bacterium CG_2015-04_32_10]NCS83664.1 M1 family metallopeptidase [Cyanobacteria bacterium CG_2015-02_32_10]
MSHLQYFFDVEEKKSFELPGAKPHYNPHRFGQVQHIFLDLVLDIPRQIFKGICTITLTPVRKNITQLTLDAVDLTIESVLIDNISQPFDYDGEVITINLSKPTTDQDLKIAIAYNKEKPQRGLYFITPDEYYPNKPSQVWTQGEDEDSRYWFPCFDYPGQLATSEIKIEVPSDYIAISNGELIKTEEKNGNKIYHWLQPQVHPTYLMTLAVGKFTKIEDKWYDVPVNYYVEKGKETEAKISMGKTPKMIEFFSQKYGYPYPYSKYAQVCVDDFIFGGMENTSTTILTDRCLLDEKASLDNRNTESLVAHELAHQWFGDLVVIKHWSHAWIKEGAASYAEVLWTEHEYGQDEGAYYLLGEARNYLQEDSSRYRRPIVTNVYREAIELYDRHLYEKGACVYHMIRGILTEELFDKFIHTFVNDNAHKTVETIDLLRAIEKATGYNLSPLFDQYVFKGGHPDFKINYSWDSESNLASVNIKQTQAKEENGKFKDLFDLKIPFAFGYIKEGEKPELKLLSLKLNQLEQVFYFPLTQKPDFISFDVGNYHLKTVKLDYGFTELKNQLNHDPDVISRIYAAIAIGKKGNLEAVKTLTESLEKEEFWGVKVEVIKQLGKIKLNQATEALIINIQDKNPKVRKAIIEALTHHKNEASYNALKNIVINGDESYYVESSAINGLGKLATGNLDNKQGEIIPILEQILAEKSGWNEIIRSSAINALSQLKTSEKAADIIAKFTDLGIPQPLRLTAIRCLGAIAKGQKSDKLESILGNFEAIMSDTFFLTQMSLISALGQIEDAQAISMLTNLADTTPDGRVKRRAEEAINQVRSKLGSDKTVKDLQQAIDKLKEENQDLQTRLAKLEAK